MWVLDTIAKIRAHVVEFHAWLKGQLARGNFKQLCQEINQRCDAVVHAQNQHAVEVAKVQEDVYYICIESKR